MLLPKQVTMVVAFTLLPTKLVGTQMRPANILADMVGLEATARVVKHRNDTQGDGEALHDELFLKVSRILSMNLHASHTVSRTDNRGL